MLVTAKKRQSLLDILLVNQGSIANICEVAISNNKSLTELPVTIEISQASNNITNLFKSYNVPANFFQESEQEPIGEAQISFNLQIYE